MRVAIYHNQLAGGAARVIEEYLKYAPKGNEYELFMPDTADTGFIKLERFVKKTHRIPLPGSNSALGRYRRALSIRSYGKAIAKRIDAGNFDVVFANMSIVTQSPEILPYLKTPSVYFCPEPLRSVYDQSPMPGPTTPRSVAKKAFFAGYDQLRKGFDREAIRKADLVITNSKFTRSRLKEVYGVDSKVISHGVDTAIFKPLNVKRQGFVLSVGAMHPLKGHQFIIESIATIKPVKRPKFVVVGSRGDFGKTLQNLAKKYGVELDLRSGMPTAKVVKAYNQAGTLAVASYNEPFGLTTLEAMATKTPVVAVDEGGFRESVTDGKTGYLVKRDPKAFGAVIDRVLSNPVLAKKLGENGYRDVKKRWGWKGTSEEIERYLEQTARTRG
ncbi:glycosyltransferase family 1 protein [Patescibacteria group bacterium]|nr:glycosyltransferase family 1 protein [Patescibacteria group bacterium]